MKVIEAVARYIAANKSLKALEIAVYTDNNGKRRMLRALSKARAERVKAYLVRRAGLAPHQVRAMGKGPAEPIADNGTLAGRSRNRRVEIRVLQRTAPPPSRAKKSSIRRPPAGATTPQRKSVAPAPKTAARKALDAKAPTAAAAAAGARPTAAPARRQSDPARPPAARPTTKSPQGPPPARPSTPAAGGPPPARPTP